MPRKYVHDLKRKIYRKPDPQNLAKAIAEIEAKKLSIRKSAAKFNIHYSVVYRHLNNKNLKPQGGQTALSANEEAFIVSRLKICGDWGYPLDSFALRMLIKEYLEKSERTVKQFKNNTPGKDFAYSFLKRHKKELSERLCQNIKRSRAAVSPEIITEYFDRLESELKDVPPENIVNYDETNLSDDPGKKKVIVRRGCKYPERIMNSSKSSTSVMFSCAGDGSLLPVYVVYKAVHLYDSWTEGGPKLTRYNRTKSGWFDSNCFEDWVRTVAVPYFKKINGKKILIGDNLSSHLSIESIRLCLKHNIHFIFLPSNSTHLTQVLDVTFFAPLKRNWRAILTKWKMGAGRNMSTVPKDKFPRLLTKLVKNIEPNASNNVKSGFKKCGIIPIDREQVLKMLPTENIISENADTDHREKEHLDGALISFLKSLRYEDENSGKPKRKSRLKVPPGKSIGVEDFEESELSESSDDDEIENGGMEAASVSESSDEDCTMDVKETIFKQETYPFPIKSDDIRNQDWLLVKFFYSSNKPGNLTFKTMMAFRNSKKYIKNRNFEEQRSCLHWPSDRY